MITTQTSLGQLRKLLILSTAWLDLDFSRVDAHGDALDVDDLILWMVLVIKVVAS